MESAILKKRPEAYYDLDGVLKRFKSELLSPLRNPVNVFVVMILRRVCAKVDCLCT